MRKVAASTWGSSHVPMGTPTRPGTTNTATRRQSICRQISGIICTCATSEQMITSEAATVGEMT